MPSHRITTAFSYVRFSSKKQEQGDSRRRQTDGRAAAYCKRRGWALSPQTYEDLGVSAFKGKNALVGNLGEFLKAVQAGRVKAGSALICESLDRISRQGIDEGYDLIKGLLKAGIILVTLTPEREFDRDATRSLSKGALEIQLILERAAEESERKSERVAAARQQERNRLRETGDIVSRRLPAWITEKDGKPVLIEKNADAVRLVFQLAADGYGVPAIVAKLTRDGVAPIGRNGEWCRSYVGLLLRDRRVLGEFTPKKGNVADGDTINFFPPAITPEAWRAARAGAQQRKRFHGRVGKRRINIFAGILQHARDGDSYIMTTRLSRSPSKEDTRFNVLINKASESSTARGYSIPYDPFEEAILSCLHEIDVREVLGEPAGDGDAVTDLEKQLEGVQAELGDARAFMEGRGFSATIGRRIVELEEKERHLKEQLEAEEIENAHPLADSWRDAQDLIDALKSADDPEDARLRLRSAIRRITDVAMLLIVPRGRARLCGVQFHFREGARRDYLLYYRPASKSFGKPSPASWSCRSLANLGDAEDLDLRRPEDATGLEEVLMEMDLADLAQLD
jgi:DNA invertase Pin-like site-specific DNA recombinase